MKVYGVFSKKLDQRIDMTGRITTRREAEDVLRTMKETAKKYFNDTSDDLEIRCYEIKYR